MERERAQGSLLSIVVRQMSDLFSGEAIAKLVPLISPSRGVVVLSIFLFTEHF